jgi:hypothetical protein
VSKAWSRGDKIAILSLVIGFLISLLAILIGHVDQESPKPSHEENAIIVKQEMDNAKMDDPSGSSKIRP